MLYFFSGSSKFPGKAVLFFDVVVETMNTYIHDMLGNATITADSRKQRSARLLVINDTHDDDDDYLAASSIIIIVPAAD